MDDRPGADTDLASQLLSLLTDSPTGLLTFTDDVVTAAGRRLGHGCEVAATLHDGRRCHVVGSCEQATACDRAQPPPGPGPARAAHAAGRALVMRDVSRAPWPRWRDAAARHGFRAATVTPARVDTVSLTVTSYSHGPARVPVTVVTDVVRAIALRLRMEAGRRTVGQLHEALAARAVIDQAIGVLMARRRCDAAAAMQTLKEESHRRGVTVGVVSAQLVEEAGGAPVRSAPFTPPATGLTPS